MGNNLQVQSVSIPEILNYIQRGRWLVPAFQREFQWQVSQVEALADSIVKQRPIGMATLWQVDPGLVDELNMDFVSVRDYQGVQKFGEGAANGDRFAILDGRQRCTALAMVFGGLAPTDRRQRGSGKFFLNLRAHEDEKWVEFKRKAEVAAKLDTTAKALQLGYMPLVMETDGDGRWSTKPWQDCLKLLYTKEIWPQGKAPVAEIDGWIARVHGAQDGLKSVQLAAYVLDDSYDLAQICEVFEILNTSGVQVSTADLIHTFVYQETWRAGAMNVREWMDELGALPGAQGWSSSMGKPERVAQMVTSAYIGLSDEAKRSMPPRVLSRRPSSGPTSVVKVSTIKAIDLLRTPTAHWVEMRDKQEELATLLGRFQRAVAGGVFPLSFCPYPAVASVYIGIGWSRVAESLDADACWELDDLDVLMRAFFWRNALTNRYEQGFLSQAGTDLVNLRDILRSKGDFQSPSEWLRSADKLLSALIDRQVPDVEVLKKWCLDGKEGGARRDALRLLLWTRVGRDLMTGAALPSPGSDEVELHHLWPKKWLAANRGGKLKKLLDEAEASDRDMISCTANLVPLLGTSNREWSANSPGTVFQEKNVSFESHKDTLLSAFITRPVFDLLLTGAADGYPEAVELRAEAIAEAVLEQSRLGV